MRRHKADRHSGGGETRPRPTRGRQSGRTIGRESAPAVPLDSPDTLRLLHELSVRKFELELQNDELLRTRRDLEENLSRYTELFDFAPIGYASLGPGDHVRELNITGALLLGRERARLIGRRFGEFVATRDGVTFRDLLVRAYGSETRETCELELHVGDRRAIQVRLTAAPMIRGTMMLAFEDITQRKQKEMQLAASEAALREADRHKDDFIAILSHELRNPLAPIRTGLFVLSQVSAESEEAQSMRAIIDRQVTHMARLINDLLDATRIRSGKIVLQLERVELAELVRRAVEDHRHGFEAREITLETRLEDAPIHVLADPVRLVQVVSNLLGNAEKFTPEHGRVVVSLAVEDARAVLRVADTGAGIDPADIDRVFEPFAQAPQTIERARGGLGLGLSMVRGLIQLHNGWVRIWSDGPNRGTTVTVALPFTSRPQVEPRTLGARDARRNLRVMIVDDQKDTADSLVDALSLVGHEVDVAYDGPNGLTRARSFRPDVLICDIGLPGMDGYAVARAARQDADLKATFLVALSGYAQPEDVQRAIDAGFDRHVAKPPDMETLSKALAEAAGSAP